jgi:hypothetical protein
MTDFGVSGQQHKQIHSQTAMQFHRVEPACLL